MQEIKITQYNKLIVNYDTYEFSPSNYKNIAIIDPWYIDVTSAPDFVVNGLTVFNNYTQETVSDEGTTVLSKIKSSKISEAKARIASYTDPTQDYPDEPIEEDPSLKTVTTVMQSYKELNNLNKITIANDTYSLHDHYIDIWNPSGSIQVHINNTPEMYHESLVKYTLRQMSNNASIITYDHYIRVNDYYAISKPDDVTVDQNDAILYPYYANYSAAALGQRQCIPRIQTITVTYDYQYLSFDLPAHQVEGYYKHNSSQTSTSKTIDIAAGQYTFTKYMNTLYKAMTGNNYGTGGTYMYQYPYMPLRRQTGFSIGFNGVPSADGTNVYNDMYCKLHCVWPQNKPTPHLTIMPANSRCLQLTSGEWTVDNLITDVNSNKDECLFTLASTDHYIYIKADTPFIINPICKIVTNDTDVAETFNTTHILLKNPMYQHFTARAGSRLGSGIEEGDFTPAEFLRWIYNKTKVKFNIRNGLISYDLGTQLTIDNNPFFINNTDTGTLENRCGFTTIPYRVVITGAAKLVGKKDYYDYNPVLEPYDYSSVNINNNITTTLNSANVVLMQ